MKILKVKEGFWLVSDDGERFFFSKTISGLLLMLNDTLTVRSK